MRYSVRVYVFNTHKTSIKIDIDVETLERIPLGEFHDIVKSCFVQGDDKVREVNILVDRRENYESVEEMDWAHELETLNIVATWHKLEEFFENDSRFTFRS